jgi:hypothetical protein
MEQKFDDNVLDRKFNQVENEWLARREELLEAREELARLDKLRVERLVKNAKQVGVPSSTPELQPHFESINSPSRLAGRSAVTSPVRSPAIIDYEESRRGTVFRNPAEEVLGIAKATLNLREAMLRKNPLTRTPVVGLFSNSHISYLFV